MPAEPVVQEIDDGPYARRVPAAFMRQEPEDASVLGPGRQALDQICVGVADDAGENRYPKARANAGQEPA